MAVDQVASAVIAYIEHGAYPDTDVASLELSQGQLTDLLTELVKVQDEVNDEVRTLSRSTAPDVDEWIKRAKELQSDIQRSQQTARAIVEEAEAGKTLKASAQDARQKVDFLEKEVAFNETLTGTLEHIRHISGLLDQAQDAAIRSDIESALVHLEDVDSSMGDLRGLGASRAYSLLSERAAQRRTNVAEITALRWQNLVVVSPSAKSITVSQPGQGDIGLNGLVGAARSLDTFSDLIQKLGHDIDRHVIRPRISVSAQDRVSGIVVEGGSLRCTGESEHTSLKALFHDLKSVVDFVHTNLGPISRDLSTIITPLVIKRLKDSWLEPAVPFEVAAMPDFHDLLDDVTELADYLESVRWQGGDDLREWVENATKTWLTKRREAILGDTRNLVFTGLRETKVVERVETQVIGQDDTLAATSPGNGANGGEGDEEDWDNAWAEEDQPESPKKTTLETTPQEDDDVSAWDVDDSENKGDAPAVGEEEAWGWGDGDEDASFKPPSPVATKKSQPLPKVNGSAASKAEPVEREVTLRERFTATSVPDSLMSILKNIVADAQLLAGDEYSDSPIAPAATALYTLPTLALAIYRATAPTAYSKLDTGNMLIYNDASHLASQLRDWQASQPPRSRLRVDNDVKALETFAKRAYSSEMDSQRTILRDLLDGAEGFSNCTVHPHKQECESAVEQTIDRLREVHRQWKNVLSQGALTQSLGTLLSSVTGKMIAEIEDLPDISEADSHQLTALCQKVTEVKDLFLQTKPGLEQSEQEAADMTFIYCPNWLKFQYLAEILESSLADIKYLWNEGELSLEFGAEEVVDLITALFTESDIRRRTVAEIRRGGRR